jgi:nitroimidazol reductase NimA-like FMN-containing flavoprotein (pyridoxamine 5'-phosphate oxidase superfamily)
MNVAEVLAKPISHELLTGPCPARLAYTGRDGAPRVVPVAFWWDGTTLSVFTVVKSAKVAALRADPRVAITIDTQGQWPPRALLVRGDAAVEVVDGVPTEYVEASRKITPADHMEAWEGGVRALYQQMVRITVTPTWAKLLDFETTIPKAVADIIAEHQAQG